MIVFFFFCIWAKKKVKHYMNDAFSFFVFRRNEFSFKLDNSSKECKTVFGKKYVEEMKSL